MNAVIAIVEDDEFVRRALCRLVRALSYRPMAFSSGDEFLAGIGAAMPDCVLMDQHMPSLNGLDVMGRIRADGLCVPVILITGFDQPSLRRQCLDAGASAFLVKPFEAALVSAAIRTALAG